MLCHMPESHFDEWIAQRYETLWPELFDPAVVDPAVSFLAELAGPGPALELGIGTGRIALPLSRRGVRVHGIELSRAMVAQLQTQPGAAEIGVTVGDFATAVVERDVHARLPLAQHDHEPDDPGRAGRSASATPPTHLEPGGCFVIENYIPDLQRLPPGETTHVFTATPEHLGFEEYDVATQIAISHHYWVIDGQLKTYSSPHRYRMAVRARPHGAARRPDLARALERLAPCALHEREPQPHLGLGEAGSRLTIASRASR